MLNCSASDRRRSNSASNPPPNGWPGISVSALRRQRITCCSPGATVNEYQAAALVPNPSGLRPALAVDHAPVERVLHPGGAVVGPEETLGICLVVR